MPFAIGFRLISHEDKGLANAAPILARNLRGGLESIGKRLTASAQTRMREDTGAARKSLRTRISVNKDVAVVEVYSTLVQAFADAYGRSRGKFPPFGPGSPLFRWAQRKTTGRESANVKTFGTPKAKKTKGLRVKRTKAYKSSRTKRGSRVTLNKSQRSRAKDTAARRLAYLAAKSIYQHGIRATHWNQEALDANKNRITREVKNALERAVSEINRG